MKNRKGSAILLSMILAVQMPFTVFAGTQYTTYGEYRSGTVGMETERSREADYTTIEIASEEDLVELAQLCRLDSWSVDKMVYLNADIVLQEETNLYIPSFGGIFEGNGHTISNLDITYQGSCAGLFRYVQESGVVRNLKVTGRVTPEGTQSQAGGIVGSNYGKIYHCSFAGQVSGDNEVGGIAGVNETTGEIRQCSSSAVVIGNHSTGGIVGSNHGTLNNCSNSGSVNTYSTEVSYDLEDITIEGIEELNSTENVAVHTDCGGIAGISDGKIYYCTNSGTIGYNHVGYNMGGIVGRLHQGYIQNCTNTGHVLGRKDVGGIVGQMEPFLEVKYLNDKLQELDRETDKFFDLLDASGQSISDYGQQASSAARDLNGNLRNVSAAAERLARTGNDLWYIYNNELTGVNQDLKTLGREWSDLQDADKESGNIHDVIIGDGGIVSGGDSDNSNDRKNDGESDDNVIIGNLGDIDLGGTITVPNDTESYLTALQKFGDNVTVHVDNISGATNDRTGGVNDNLNTLNREMESAGKQLDRLIHVLEDGTTQADTNVDALVNQAKVVRGLLSGIRDDLFRYEGITIEDASDEAASKEPLSADIGQEDGAATSDTYVEEYYDTTSFQQGKITLCVNKGLVEADTNVGGIVGQIATEYDFDPEDDITFTGTESFDIEQTIKAVVRDSRNVGDIIGKKNCVGGIVGKAEFGAVISCEAYGDVSSTGGDYVGGIAGVSEYAIRSCYTMGNLSGRNYIGGVAGKGCDIFYSYAYSFPEMTGECSGAIAGSVKENGTLCGNYYVAGEMGGIDGIGYNGGATPLTYEEFSNMEGMPEMFLAFTVSFMAEGEELASYRCAYGDTLRKEQIPDIPEKEGYYGIWPEFDFDNITGNKVLEAVYEPWVQSLAGDITDENGRTKVFVEGEFLPGQKLVVTEQGNEISFTIESDTDEALTGDEEGYQGPVEVHVLCGEAKDRKNTGKNIKVEVKTDNGYVEAETVVEGSYLLFHMDAPGTFRMTQEEKQSIIIWYIVIAGVAVLLVAAVIIRRIRKVQGKKSRTDRKNPEEKEF